MHRLLRMSSTRTRRLPKDLQAGKSDHSLATYSSLLVSVRHLFPAYVFLISAEFLNPAYQALPGYLASANYTSSPTDPTDTAVQMAFDSKGKDLIGVLMERPDSARGFGTLMST